MNILERQNILRFDPRFLISLMTPFFTKVKAETTQDFIKKRKHCEAEKIKNRKLPKLKSGSKSKVLN